MDGVNSGRNTQVSKSRPGPPTQCGGRNFLFDKPKYGEISGPLLEVFSLSNDVHLIYRFEPLHHTLLAERAHNRKQTWGHALSRKRNP
jgi:hypothetical protein